jgi:antibiotic biosynthesis monooxygenase (ABM) superfamily enzyme
MGWVWLIVSIITFSISLYIIGKSEDKDRDNWIGPALMISALWPLILVFVILLGPFVGFYWLGVVHRKKKKEKSELNK